MLTLQTTFFLCSWLSDACMVSCSVVSNFLQPSWIVAHQAPLSMGFSRWEYWSGLPFPFPGDPPDLISCVSCIGRRILYHWATSEAQLSGRHTNRAARGILWGSKGGNRMKTCMTVWHGKVDWQNKGYMPQLHIFIVDFLLEHCYRAYLVQSSNLWSLLKERTVLLGVLKALLWDTSLFFFSQKIWINLLFLVVLCLHCSYRLSLVAESQGFCGG